MDGNDFSTLDFGAGSAGFGANSPIHSRGVAPFPNLEIGNPADDRLMKRFSTYRKHLLVTRARRQNVVEGRRRSLKAGAVARSTGAPRWPLFSRGEGSSGGRPSLAALRIRERTTPTGGTCFSHSTSAVPRTHFAHHLRLKNPSDRPRLSSPGCIVGKCHAFGPSGRLGADRTLRYNGEMRVNTPHGVGSCFVRPPWMIRL